MVSFGKSSGGGRRSATRETAPLLVLLSTLSRNYNAILSDISATGVRLNARDLPDIGSELYFSVGEVKTVATVRWRTGEECGLQFYEPLLKGEVIGVRRLAAKSAGLHPVLSAALDDWVPGVAR